MNHGLIRNAKGRDMEEELVASETLTPAAAHQTALAQLPLLLHAHEHVRQQIVR